MRLQATHYTSCSGSVLYFGFRSAFGVITTPAFTGPTRSRAMARTSFVALKTCFFRFAMRFALAYTDCPTSDSVTRIANWSKVTTS